MPYVDAGRGRPARPRCRCSATTTTRPTAPACATTSTCVDLAEGHVAALRYLLERARSITVNLGTGRGHSVLEVVRAFERASGRPVPYEIVARRPGDVAACYADPRCAQPLLGWRARATSTRCAPTAGAGRAMNPERLRLSQRTVRHEPDSTSSPSIMAGGSGTRLWPLSRAQLSRSSSSRCTATAACSSRPCCALRGAGRRRHRGRRRRWSSATRSTASWCSTSCASCALPRAALLLEPAGRNTAPAMTLAALHALAARRRPGAGRHAGRPDRDRRRRLHAPRCSSAVRAAADGAIVILGIAPDRPETGFGYIRADAGDGATARTVRAFVEKPDLATAERYLADGGYFWNSGMFVLRASVWLRGARALPARHRRRRRARPGTAAAPTRSFVRPDKAAFAAVPERIGRLRGDGAAAPGRSGFDIRMVPLDAGWSDLGAWDAVWQVSAQGRRRQRRARRRAAARTAATRWCTPPAGWSASSGSTNVVVVETPDAVLVADREPQPGRQAHRRRARTAPAAASTRCTARCTGPGAGTTASTPARASRSSASWSSRARR